MTQGSEQAPAGWYNDPHFPERMRYFDGEAWTNHFHNPGELPTIGSWINTTFSVFGRHWRGAALIAFVTSLAGNLVVWFALRSIVSDLEVVDESVLRFSSAEAIGLGALAVFGLVWQGFGWLSLNRYMQRAHFQAEPSVAEAFTHALRRLPRYLRVVLRLVAAGLVILVVLGGLLAAVPLLGALAILGSVVAMVWVVVKVSFISAATVAAPLESDVLRTSAAVSTDRFWPVLGRITLLIAVLAIGGNILSSVLGTYGSAIDADQLADNFVFEGDSLVVTDFRFRDLFASTGTMLIVVAITSIIRTVTTMISTSATMRLYLDSGAPTEIG